MTLEAITHALNTIIVNAGVSVDIFFQKCPGADSSTGIGGIPFTIRIDGEPPVNGVTGSDGKISVSSWSPTQRCVIEIFNTEYKLQHVPLLDPITTTVGVKARLQILGYYTGAVDSTINKETELSVLAFQADHSNLRVDGIAGTNSKIELTNTLGY